jgi:hypothetical protein
MWGKEVGREVRTGRRGGCCTQVSGVLGEPSSLYGFPCAVASPLLPSLESLPSL